MSRDLLVADADLIEQSRLVSMLLLRAVLGALAWSIPVCTLDLHEFAVYLSVRLDVVILLRCFVA